MLWLRSLFSNFLVFCKNFADVLKHIVLYFVRLKHKQVFAKTCELANQLVILAAIDAEKASAVQKRISLSHGVVFAAAVKRAGALLPHSRMSGR